MAEPKHDPGPWAYDPELNRVRTEIDRLKKKLEGRP